jgi:ABC-type uncharacterized transport system ATPase subunit
VTTASVLAIHSNQKTSYLTKTSKIVEAPGLTKVYPPSSKAVDGVCFTVEEGRIFGFLGPNCAGNGVAPRNLEFLATVWKMQSFLEELGEGSPNG